jgi:hypothetical protein
MVAQQLSLTLGPVQTFTEQSIDYLGYCGVGLVPGVGATGATGATGAPTVSGTTTGGQLKPIPAKPKKHKTKTKTKTKKPKAMHQAHTAQASDNTCQIEADVTIAYSAS